MVVQSSKRLSTISMPGITPLTAAAISWRERGVAEGGKSRAISKANSASTTRMKNWPASTRAGLSEELSKKNADSSRPAKGASTFSCRCAVTLVQAILYPITLPP